MQAIAKLSCEKGRRLMFQETGVLQSREKYRGKKWRQIWLMGQIESGSGLVKKRMPPKQTQRHSCNQNSNKGVESEPKAQIY
eukprot:763602-Hanusia_phi.AAC.6